MQNIDISDKKIKFISKSILKSKFFICGYGHFDLEPKEYELFVKALFSKNPLKELNDLYELIK